MDLSGNTVLLGVTGSIAAYKAADLCSQLGKRGVTVHVVLTQHAAQFVRPATFRALTRQPVIADLFDEPHTDRIAHIDLAQSADLVVVAPATANLLAKLAHGIADDMLSTCLLAVPPDTPLLLAPAMNTVMWDNPATRANVDILRRRGAQFVEPGYGLLACQDVGTGKLADVDEIVAAVESLLSPRLDLTEERVLVTAGATREPLDPVRFFTNRSSGRMGYAIAEEAARRGASVTLVTGHASLAPPAGVKVITVETADHMFAACEREFERATLFVGAAAVADYAPEIVAPAKIKKSYAPGDKAGTLLVRMRATQDILATLGGRKRADQIVVGFAAETEDLIANARRKLHSKNADLIVANDVTLPGAGFDVDTNIVTLVALGSEQELPLLTKREVAGRLLDETRRIRASRAPRLAAVAPV